MGCGCGKSKRTPTTADAPNPNTQAPDHSGNNAWWQANPSQKEKPSTVAVPIPS